MIAALGVGVLVRILEGRVTKLTTRPTVFPKKSAAMISALAITGLSDEMVYEFGPQPTRLCRWWGVMCFDAAQPPS